jgi:hypothetical protein
MNMAVFWDIAPCSLVATDRRFRVAYCLQYASDMWPANRVDNEVGSKMIATKRETVWQNVGSNCFAIIYCTRISWGRLMTVTRNLSQENGHRLKFESSASQCQALIAEREQVRKIHNMSFRHLGILL